MNWPSQACDERPISTDSPATPAQTACAVARVEQRHHRLVQVERHEGVAACFAQGLRDRQAHQLGGAGHIRKQGQVLVGAQRPANGVRYPCYAPARVAGEQRDNACLRRPRR